jgi:Uma2 family endonuclease
MDVAERTSRVWTAEEFLRTDQQQFGDAWRYELVDGRIIAHAAPAPDHGAIIMGLGAALAARLRSHPDGCRPEAGSGAAPKRQQRNTARIPDAMIRCRESPRVMFDVISPSELRHWRARDRKRKDLQDVEGVEEVVDIYQREMALHVYRREPDGKWSFEPVGEPDGVLHLRSMGIEVPLSEIYEFAMPLPNDEDEVRWPAEAPEHRP